MGSALTFRGLRRTEARPTPVDPRLPALLQRKSVRVVTVAAANRTARVAWAIMTRGGIYHTPVATAVGQRVAFAPDGPPGWIVAALACHPDTARACGLRIRDTAGRAGLASNPLPVSHGKSMGEALEHACLRQAQKPVMHLAPGREVQRQVPPRAACAQHVQDAWS